MPTLNKKLYILSLCIFFVAGPGTEFRADAQRPRDYSSRSFPSQWSRQCYQRMVAANNVSRTITSYGYRARIARRNYERAAHFVARNFKRLKVDYRTACLINRIINKHLIHPRLIKRTDQNIPESCKIWTWLETDDAKNLERKDPVAFAERLTRSSYPEFYFTDGNGRTFRLLASLTLMKNGIKPPSWKRNEWFHYMSINHQRQWWSMDGNMVNDRLVETFRAMIQE